MAERVASLYAEIGADTSKLQKGLKETKTGLRAAKFSFTELASAVALVDRGLGYVKDAIDQTVGVTVEYTKQIRELTQVTGGTAEELSRVVQVADDWGISIDQVRSALVLMNKNGMAPTIDNLADLADEYVNTTDKTKFAERANQLFGRQYATLIPLFAKGGAALREQAAAVSSSLVVTQKGIRQAREYEVAMDNFGDAVFGAKIALGNQFLPALTKFLQLATSPDADKAAEFINTVFAGTPIESAAGKQARATTMYGQALEDAAAAQTAFYSGVVKVNEMMAESEPIVYDYVYRVTDVDHEASRAAQAVTNFAIGVDKTGEAADAAKGPVKGFLDGIDRDIASPIANFIKDLEWMSATGGVIEQAFADIQKALDAHEITPEQAAAFAGELLVAAKDVEVTLDPTKLKDAAADLEDTLGKAAARVATQQIKGTDGIEGALQAVTGIQYYLDFKFRYTGTPPSAYTGGGTTTLPTGPNPRAAGGPVMAGMPYMVGERGPEMFVPSTAGNIIPNGASSGGGTNISIAIYPTPGMDEATVGNIVAQKLSIAFRNMRAGGYARGA